MRNGKDGHAREMMGKAMVLTREVWKIGKKRFGDDSQRKMKLY